MRCCSRGGIEFKYFATATRHRAELLTLYTTLCWRLLAAGGCWRLLDVAVVLCSERAVRPMLGVIRSTPSVCALAFGLTRPFNAPSFHGRVLGGVHRSSCSRPIDTLRSGQARRRTLCVWAAATEAVIEYDRAELDAREFEHELDAMDSQEEDGGDGEEPSGQLPSPARLR